MRIADGIDEDIVRLRVAIDQSVSANQDMPSSAALLVIRISNMTKAKKLFGDRAAQIVMTEIEKRLKKVVRHTDAIGRLGEDQFGIVLSRCPPDKIPAAGKRFLAAATSAPINTIDGSIEVTISIISVGFPDEGLTSSEVIARAETRMHEARSAA
jgi:two-component system cell cycle response regulator